MLIHRMAFALYSTFSYGGLGTIGVYGGPGHRLGAGFGCEGAGVTVVVIGAVPSGATEPAKPISADVTCIKISCGVLGAVDQVAPG